MFVGYHARNGSPNAVLDHTWSSRTVANVWLNDILTGEYGLNAAVAGHFGVPVIMASGDQTLCAEVRELFGNKIETAQVKNAVSRMSAECLPPAVTASLIEETARRAVINLRSKKTPKPLKVTKPINLLVKFEQSEMADKAALMPNATRTVERRVEYVAPDMVTIYLAFRTMLALAR